MNRTMIIASNTMNQLQQQLDIISHNIANVDTTGFKKRTTTFSELMYQQFNNQPNPEKEVGRLTAEGIRQGTGAKLAQAALVLTQGTLKQTGRDLDVAILDKRQFFKVLVADEDGGTSIQLTRDGAFYLSPVGENQFMLVNGSGLPIVDVNENIITFGADAKKFTISNNGDFTVQYDNGAQETFELGMVSILRPQFLEQKGNGLLGMPENVNELGEDVWVDLVGENRTDIQVAQGALEQSNVDLGKEMTDMLQVQRSYQFQARAISIADQMLGLINGIR
jgi:flagellar basal-body rod protein FlgG